MEIFGQGEDEVNDVLGEGASALPFDLKSVSLVLSGQLTSHEQPENTFRERFLVGLISSVGVSLGQEFLKLGDRVVSEDDSLVGVAARQVTHETLHATHTTDDLLNGVLTDNFVAILFLDFLKLSLLLRNDLSEDLLKVGVRAHGSLALLEEGSHFL